MPRPRLSTSAGWLAALAAGLAVAPAAHAHVKWFSRFSYGDAPRGFVEVVSSPLVIGLALLAALVIGGFVLLDRRLDGTPTYRRLQRWLDDHRAASGGVLRAAAGASLLLSWQAESLLAPELPLPAAWVGWLQFAVAVALVFGPTVPLAGLGLLGLYAVAVFEHGVFHLLDYAVFAGVGYALLVGRWAGSRLGASGLPVLYATTGFSLLWLGLEKLVYPGWGGYVLQQNPALTMGFDVDFFLTGAAFVEIALGFLLMIGLLERPLAVVITLVFFTTTLIFGKPEVIGHTLLHGALVVFLLEGPGSTFTPPYRFHRTTRLRVAFAAVNFLLVTGALLAAYTVGAARMQANAAGHTRATQTPAATSPAHAHGPDSTAAPVR